MLDTHIDPLVPCCGCSSGFPSHLGTVPALAYPTSSCPAPNPAPACSNVRIGVGINNAKLCGCILVPLVDQREYLARFPQAFEAVKSGTWRRPARRQTLPCLQPPPR
jgi:hypothetical protein